MTRPSRMGLLVLGTALMFGRGLTTVESAQLGPALFVRVTQSSDASATNGALRAVDGSSGTFSLTANSPNSYWLAELGRAYPVEYLEIIGRSTPNAAELNGLRLRLLDLDDQVVFEKTLTNITAGGTNTVNVTPGLRSRSVWIGLPDGGTNGAGNYRVGLAEVRLFGEPAIPNGPPPVTGATNRIRTYQSSDYSSGYPPDNAIDGNLASFTHTANEVDDYWMVDLGEAEAVDRVELVNRADCCGARLGGLVLHVFDGASNSVVSATVTNPGLGAKWSYSLPAGTKGRYFRVGLENGQKNADGNYYVTLAEVRLFSGTRNLLMAVASPVPIVSNLASFKHAYMVSLTSSLPPASNANDNNYATETKTTMQSVDAYWEVDLGTEYALYAVRAIGASGIGRRLTNTIVRLYSDAHDSVFAKRLTGTPEVFDCDLNGPVTARYVRIGLENKQRTDPAGSLEWYIGMREVEVFGRPANEVGILDFSTPSPRIAPGETATLDWNVQDIRRAEIHPAIGSVGAFTAVSGSGQLKVTPLDSTEYILVASNATGFLTRAVSIGVGNEALPVRISEIVAANQYSLRDGYGEAPDWIELRNTGNTVIDLAGYGLSDDLTRPMKWVFPATQITPHSALVVFASGRNTVVDPGGHLHTSFRLNNQGGSLVLTAPDGVTTVDALPAYPALDTDLAYGRDLEHNWTYLEPTPGALNIAPTYSGWLHPLEFSHPAGFYETAFTLTLTNQNLGSSVFYSLDGSVPSIPYTAGINIPGAKAVRAQVVRSGYRPARIQTRTFIFPANVIASSVMHTTITRDTRYAARLRPGLLSLPSISLVVPGQPEYREKEGSVEILWPNGPAPVQANCDVSRFGGSWQEFAKKSFRIKCRARYGTAKIQTTLLAGFDRGVPVQTSFDELEFRSGSQDMVDRGFYMAGPFVQDSMLDMGSLNPHGRFVHVYLNGVYWGQFDAREALVEHFLADYLGGTPEQYVNVRGNDNVGDSFIPGTPEPPNVAAWERVRSLKGSFIAVRPYVDVSNLIDFMLVWLYGDCESEYRACGPIEAGTGFKFWIADADGFLRTSASGSNRTGSLGPGDLFGALVAEGHPDFKALLADRIYRHCFNDGALTPARNTSRLAARMGEIHDSLILECARWGYRTPSNWESAAATIRSSLFPVRTTQLISQFRSRGFFPAFDPPTFNQYGGTVTNGFQVLLTSTKGTVYYTLDGSDPRLPGGTISPQARAGAAGGVAITEDVTLSARVRASTGQWSALAQTRFLTPRQAPASQDLLITEINYHPADSEDDEFIELLNNSTNLLDLSGVSLTNAVRFVFTNGYALAPGAIVLILKDAGTFARRYQDPASPYYAAGLQVAGEWDGNLGNQGESVSLVASNGLELGTVPYQAGGDWPERANGYGSTLELRSLPPNGADETQVRSWLADGRNWTSSSLYHGSPGRLDSFVKAVRINEVRANAVASDDWVELLNTSEQPVDLTNCSVTDDLAVPLRWQFPAGTVLGPGAFRVLTGVELNFGFDRSGDQAWLLRMSGSNVVRFLDSVDFPAAAITTFGLYRKSDHEMAFTELSAGTPGGTNAVPHVGPVVISEICPMPATGRSAFVELVNVSSEPVALFDPAHPTNTWRLSGVGDFSFPAGVVLPAGKALVVCATNPAVFSAQYGLEASVPVFGPWPGILKNDGDTLRLWRPGAPEIDGDVPYDRVDHVAYRSAAPWPPRVEGVSIEKSMLAAYGNDAISWRLGPLNGTPGTFACEAAFGWFPQPAVQFPAGLPWTIPLGIYGIPCTNRVLSWRASGLPAGFALDTNALRIVGTGSSPGDYLVELTLSDGGDPAGTAKLAFKIQLTEPFVLTALSQTGATWLSFPAILGQTYRVQSSDQLTPPDWRLIQEVANVSTNIVRLVDPFTSGGSPRFYRVQWLR